MTLANVAYRAEQLRRESVSIVKRAGKRSKIDSEPLQPLLVGMVGAVLDIALYCRTDEKVDRFATRWSVPQHFRGQGPAPVVKIACNTLNAPSCLVYLRHEHSVQGQAELEPDRHYREIKC